MSDHIEIKIDSTRLTPHQFLEASQAFLSVVQGVAKNISGHPLDWTIEVEKGSALLRMHSEIDDEKSIASINAVTKGLKSLNEGVRQMPYGFTHLEMRGVRTLAELCQTDGMREISIRNGNAPEHVRGTIIPVIDSIITRETHDEFGSIEGTVIALSLRQGFICTIQDPIEQRDILCYLQNQESQDNVYKALPKRARILADGLIHYSKEGFPVSITADVVRVFPDENELPTVTEVQAIYKLHK